MDVDVGDVLKSVGGGGGLEAEHAQRDSSAVGALRRWISEGKQLPPSSNTMN